MFRGMPRDIPSETNEGGSKYTGCSGVPVKVPNFWPANAKLFFVQLEASFRLVGISVEQTKFDYFVASLDTETLPSPILCVYCQRNRIVLLKRSNYRYLRCHRIRMLRHYLKILI